MLNHSVSSRCSPEAVVYLRLEATLNFVTEAPWGGIAHFGISSDVANDDNLVNVVLLYFGLVFVIWD